MTARKRVTVPAAMKPAYQQLGALHRLGLIDGFFYGSRRYAWETPPVCGTDNVWNVRLGVGIAVAADDKAGRASIRTVPDDVMAAAEIVELVVGPSWCGYPALTVKYADGRIYRERYDGRKVIRTVHQEGQRGRPRLVAVPIAAA